MNADLQRVLGEQAIVYASGNRIMGLSADYPSPVQIGSDRKGVVAALAWTPDNILYHLERYGAKAEYKPTVMRESSLKKSGHPALRLRSALINSINGRRMGNGFDDMAVHNGELYAVKSPKWDLEGVMIINPFTQEVLMSARPYARHKMSAGQGYLRIVSSPQGLHVFGAQQGFIWHNTRRGMQSRRVRQSRLEILQGSSTEFVLRDGDNIYYLENVINSDRYRNQAIIIGKAPEEFLGYWKLSTCDEKDRSGLATGVVYMATIVNHHIVIGTLDENGNNLRSIPLEGIRKRKKVHDVPLQPGLLVPDAFVKGEKFLRNNPIITLPCRKDLDYLVRETTD